MTELLIRVINYPETHEEKTREKKQYQVYKVQRIMYSFWNSENVFGIISLFFFAKRIFRIINVKHKHKVKEIRLSS